MFWFGLIITILAGGAVGAMGERRKWSEKKSGGVALSVMGVVASLLIGLSISGEEAKPKTPEELHQQRIESQFSAWNGAHRNLETAVKQAMNDPDSYEHVDTTYTDRGDHVFIRMNFRGNNAFGGTVINQVVAKADLDGKIILMESRNQR